MQYLPKLPGIYIIEVGPRTFYVGQTNNLRKRQYVHRSTLHAGTHHNDQLQRSFNKHGDFRYRALFVCEQSELNSYEEAVIANYWEDPAFANIAQFPGSPTRGTKRSAETLAKMSAALKGKRRTPEQRAQMSERRRGYRHKDETRKKIAEAHRGKPKPYAQRAKLFKRIEVRYSDGTVEQYESQKAFAAHLGIDNSCIGKWLKGTAVIPSKHNIQGLRRF